MHTPPPRHVRLAWPATETFDALLPSLSLAPVGRELTRREDNVGASQGPKRVDFSVVLCTMFKNEALYLEEWLEYHQMLGVSKVSR